jgi:hypothetical protein
VLQFEQRGCRPLPRRATGDALRNDSGDWLVVPGDDNLLAPRDAFEQLTEPRLGVECRYACHAASLRFSTLTNH